MKEEEYISAIQAEWQRVFLFKFSSKNAYFCHQSCDTIKNERILELQPAVLKICWSGVRKSALSFIVFLTLQISINLHHASRRKHCSYIHLHILCMPSGLLETSIWRKLNGCDLHNMRIKYGKTLDYYYC